jgi:hypothetical protein
MDIEALTKRFEENVKIYSDHYEKGMDDKMGELYNKFVSFISTSQVPLNRVLIILELLKDEIIKQAKEKYLGG